MMIKEDCTKANGHFIVRDGELAFESSGSMSEIRNLPQHQATVFISALRVPRT